MDNSRISRLDPKIIAVLFTVIIAGVVCMKIPAERGGSGERSVGRKEETVFGNKTSSAGTRFNSRIRRDDRSDRRGQDPSASTRLRDFRDAGDFGSIHAELESLSTEDRLADVSDVLKEWCRKGEMELAQWCLAAAAESEDPIELELAAEALSNPSEIMREVAASRLEEVSGIRFMHTSEARTWLSELSNQERLSPGAN